VGRTRISNAKLKRKWKKRQFGRFIHPLSPKLTILTACPVVCSLAGAKRLP
jgi:hypothetical protein